MVMSCSWYASIMREMLRVAAVRAVSRRARSRVPSAPGGVTHWVWFSTTPRDLRAEAAVAGDQTGARRGARFRRAPPPQRGVQPMAVSRKNTVVSHRTRWLGSPDEHTYLPRHRPRRL